ncbi:hypothetical protein OHC33_005875 [Knufia fluminis]|uniref:BHLH domain-containing protein n=1 Tax=Knufia fluminis TaxID=191047 RepID=A0AAN8EL45_9EURO|nr:hypothetical protein OHC33_005875 [Knufia fluminis]
MPFGYNPNGIHGIGLPTYMNQGQPPPQSGQPLLSEQETEQMQDFFSTFEAENQAHANPMHGQFTDNMAQLQQLQMPNTYVGHEVNMRSPQSSMDWHGQQMNPFQFGHPMNQMAMQTPTSPYGNTNGHMASPVHNMFPMHQNNMQTFNNNWQQAFPTHPMPGRPDVTFGSDPNFLSNGYTAPDGTMDADLSLLTYAMAPTSSASNTQPNSRNGSNANTVPSSPVATKKRKLNTFQSESLRMTPANGLHVNGVVSTQSPPPPTSARKPRKSFVKHEQQPPTPLSKTPTTYDEDDVQEEDAEYDEEDPDINDQPRSASPPAPWPSSKARPIHKDPPPPKPAKPRKQSSATPSKQPKARRASSGLANAIARTPLTAEQKKANHTNSEQRRRDATARSYAELYDMVPELNEQGKQSTMKKLEVVVTKVESVKARLEYLRQVCGRDVATGEPLPDTIAQTRYSGDMSHLSGWALPGQQ